MFQIGDQIIFDYDELLCNNLLQLINVLICYIYVFIELEKLSFYYTNLILF